MLSAAMLKGHHVADDPRGCLELVKLLARLGVNRLQIAFKRPVEHYVACRRQGTRPDRELFLVRPDNLARLGVPGNEIAHMCLTLRRGHLKRRAHIKLTSPVVDLEKLVV